jgi:hypothetical protein
VTWRDKHYGSVKSSVCINKNMNTNITFDQIKNAIEETNSMLAASAFLQIHYSTFKRYALKYGLYKPNQGGKGSNKPCKNKYDLHDILNGKHPQYSTYKLKHRLYECGLKTNQCEKCGISEWNGITIACELDHIDGNRTNHSLENLRVLCPNCHSQTSTFRSKNLIKT